MFGLPAEDAGDGEGAEAGTEGASDGAGPTSGHWSSYHSHVLASRGTGLPSGHALASVVQTTEAGDGEGDAWVSVLG